MLEITTNHFLKGDQVEILDCPKNTKKFSVASPDTIILHYTAGSSASSSARYLAQNGVKASAHLVIGRDGKIIQLVPFDTIAWHAGISSYGSRKGMNNYSIGIELDNAGVLERTGDMYTAWTGKQYPTSEVVAKVHRNENRERYWHTYTEKQIKVCQTICDLLIDKYAIGKILGHEEVSPGRKVDPGPAFPLDKFRQLLLHQDRDIDSEPAVIPSTGKVAATVLNIRKGPGVRYEKLEEQLSKNSEVEILSEKNGWYQIEVATHGWVSSNYIQTN